MDDSKLGNATLSKVDTRKKVMIHMIVGYMKETSRRNMYKIGPSHISARGKYATRIEVNAPLDLERKDSSVRVILPLAFFFTMKYNEAINIIIAIANIIIATITMPPPADRPGIDGIAPAPPAKNNARRPTLRTKPTNHQIIVVVILIV